MTKDQRKELLFIIEWLSFACFNRDKTQVLKARDSLQRLLKQIPLTESNNVIELFN